MKKLRNSIFGLLVATLAFAGSVQAASCIMNIRGDDGKIHTLVIEGDTCTLDRESGACACS